MPAKCESCQLVASVFVVVQLVWKPRVYIQLETWLYFLARQPHFVIDYALVATTNGRLSALHFCESCASLACLLGVRAGSRVDGASLTTQCWAWRKAAFAAAGQSQVLVLLYKVRCSGLALSKAGQILDKQWSW